MKYIRVIFLMLVAFLSLSKGSAHAVSEVDQTSTRGEYYRYEGATRAPAHRVVMANTAQPAVLAGEQRVVAYSTYGTAYWVQNPSAQRYNIYYRPANSTGYTHSVVVPREGSNIKINYLNPYVTYYYKVAAVVDGKEQWMQEKVLKYASTTNEQGAVAMTPPTPTAIGGSAVMKSDSMMTKTSAHHGSAVVSWSGPSKPVAKIHVYFGTSSGNYQHSVRDLDQNARQLTLHHLTASTYYYRVQFVGTDGATWWNGEQMVKSY